MEDTPPPPPSSPAARFLNMLTQAKNNYTQEKIPSFSLGIQYHSNSPCEQYSQIQLL